MSDIVKRIREVFDDTPEIVDMCDESYEGQEIASHLQGLYETALEAADEIERLREMGADWRAAMTENHDLWRENERLRNLVEHYAAQAFGGAIVAADEQYPLIANAMKAITALEGEKTND
jgi:regulator of replication initiation timing